MPNTRKNEQEIGRARRGPGQKVSTPPDDSDDDGDIDSGVLSLAVSPSNSSRSSTAAGNGGILDHQSDSDGDQVVFSEKEAKVVVEEELELKLVMALKEEAERLYEDLKFAPLASKVRKAIVRKAMKDWRLDPPTGIPLDYVLGKYKNKVSKAFSDLRHNGQTNMRNIYLGKFANGDTSFSAFRFCF